MRVGFGPTLFIFAQILISMLLPRFGSNEGAGADSMVFTIAAPALSMVSRLFESMATPKSFITLF